MKPQKLRLGLVGKDVSKSDSERIHKFILREFGVECAYEKISVDVAAFDDVIRRLLGDFDGFNVTIPYKRDVMSYLDDISGDAFGFGAVNTVVSATRTGYNTDGVGFLLMLQAAGVEVSGKRVLVLGGGGAGRSSAAALKKAGAEVYVYQRRQDKLRELCSELGVRAAENPESGGYDLLVNCTGVGMHDSVGVSPVTVGAFAGATVAVDLIYKPAESEFLRLAKTAGLKTVNGAAMLFYQAYYADCLYLGIPADEAQARALYARYLQEDREQPKGERS